MSRREDHEAREADHLAALVEAGEVAISEADGLPVVDGRRSCLACRLPIEGDPSKLYHDTCRAAVLPYDAAAMTSGQIKDALTGKRRES
jgi:hypothetical protein